PTGPVSRPYTTLLRPDDQRRAQEQDDTGRPAGLPGGRRSNVAPDQIRQAVDKAAGDDHANPLGECPSKALQEWCPDKVADDNCRSEEHTAELQSPDHL